MSLIQIDDDNAVDIVIKVEEEEKDDKSKYNIHHVNLFDSTQIPEQISNVLRKKRENRKLSILIKIKIEYLKKSSRISFSLI